MAVAYDTRPSAAMLVHAAEAGVSASGGVTLSAGRPLTTPALHWAVRQMNLKGSSDRDVSKLADQHVQSLRDAYLELLTLTGQVRLQISNSALESFRG